MKHMKKRRLAAAGLAAVMAATVLSGCGGSGSSSNTDSSNTESQAAGNTSSEDDIKKPEKITIMVDGTVTTKLNNRDAFEQRWEELTGIDLEIIQPDHDAYYDVLGQTFASGPENWPDAIILNGTYYTGYAEEGALWDIDSFIIRI